MIDIQNITKTYQPKRGIPVKALNEVSFTLGEKGFVFILGKSGSGKSTLLNILGGLDTLDTGDIYIYGKSTKSFTQSEWDSYRNTFVGFVFQEYNVIEEFTVEENVALAIRLQGHTANEGEIYDILRKVELEDLAKRKPNELSGGQRQRVAIARSLVKDPRMILADEPTGALDSVTGKQILHLLKELSKDKLVVVVTHDREFAETYGDRIIEIADGKIIRDRQKVDGDLQSIKPRIRFVDDRFVYVDEKYSLTDDDFNQIQQLIDQSENGVLISIDDAANQELQNYIPFQAELQTSIKEANEQFIKEDDNGSEFTLIKSRLPYKEAVKIGASSLKHKKIRLVFTILLSMISFTLFGLTDTLSAYNKETTAVNSLIDHQVNYLTFSKESQVGNEVGRTRRGLVEKDIDYIETQTGITLYPIFNSSIDGSSTIRWDNFSDSMALNENEFYFQTYAGFTSIPEEDLINQGFTIVGELPKNRFEIAITKYHFELFQVAGYRNDETGEFLAPYEIKSEQDLVGKTIRLYTSDHKRYTITGIIDTKLSSKFDRLKDPKFKGLEAFILGNEYYHTIRYGFHRLFFVSDDYLKELVTDHRGQGLRITDPLNLELRNKSQGKYNTMYYIKTLDELRPDQKVVFYDDQKTSLEPGEVLINFDIIYRELIRESLTIPDEFKGEQALFEIWIREKVEEAFLLYANATYEDAYRKGFKASLVREYSERDPETLTEDEKIDAYLLYLRDNRGREDNPFGDRTGYAIEMEIMEEIYRQYNLVPDLRDAFELEVINRNSYSRNRKEAVNIKVAGYYLGEYGEAGLLIVHEDFYDTFTAYESGPYIWAIGTMPKSRDHIQRIVAFSYNSGLENTDYRLNNEVYSFLEQIDSSVETMKNIFLYIGIAFAIFAGLLLFNFIATSITYKKQEIGILRALGARQSDVFNIFYQEALIIAGINFVLSCLMTAIGVIVLNAAEKRSLGLVITIHHFGIRQVLLLLAISVVVATVASFIPVYRFSRKRPIDAIRNR